MSRVAKNPYFLVLNDFFSFLHLDVEGGCIEKRITLTWSGPLTLMDAWKKWYMCQTYTQHSAPWRVAKKKTDWKGALEENLSILT